MNGVPGQTITIEAPAPTVSAVGAVAGGGAASYGAPAPTAPPPSSVYEPTRVQVTIPPGTV